MYNRAGCEARADGPDLLEGLAAQAGVGLPQAAVQEADLQVHPTHQHRTAGASQRQKPQDEGPGTRGEKRQRGVEDRPHSFVSDAAREGDRRAGTRSRETLGSGYGRSAEF